jgi:tripartite-type tricarboxylate transporter receptor subunit TctC
VPTAKEAGVPEFKVAAWVALFAPKGTPKPILDKLTDALDRALDDNVPRKRLLNDKIRGRFVLPASIH